MNFVTNLPRSAEPDGPASNSILVIVDRYTKMAQYIPAQNTITARDLAKIFIN